MPRATLAVDVHYGQSAGYSGNTSHTLTKEVQFEVVPSAGEEVLVGEGDIALRVKERWFDDEGSVRVELVAIQVDPNQQMLRLCDGEYRIAWWTDTDRDPVEVLTEAGFSEEEADGQ